MFRAGKEILSEEYARKTVHQFCEIVMIGKYIQ